MSAQSSTKQKTDRSAQDLFVLNTLMSPTGAVLVLGLVFGGQPARELLRLLGRFDGVRGGQCDLAIFAFREELLAVELRRAFPHRHCASHFAWRVLEACANANEHIYLLVYSYWDK